jgi:1,4-alpha-glucan branching enzyme
VNAIEIGKTDRGDLAEGWSLRQWIANEKNAQLPWKVLIAEDLQNDEWVTKTTRAGGAGLVSQWDTGFFNTVSPCATDTTSGACPTRSGGATRTAG